MSDDSLKRFPKTCTLIHEGIEKKLHTGVQLSIKHDAQVFDFGVGEAKPNVPMTSEIILPWLSAAKPITVIALARMIDAGLLSWDSPCYKFFPSWEYHELKSQLTILHLLTHTSGLQEVDHGWPSISWAESVQRCLMAEFLPEVKHVGKIASYSPQVNWFLLGHILATVSEAYYEYLIHGLVLNPLGMHDTRCVYDVVEKNYNLHRGDFCERVKGELISDAFLPRIMATTPSPGSSFCGTARDLRQVMELFLSGGMFNGELIIQEETVQEILKRHRVDMFDHTLQHKVDYGLGVILNSGHHGMETVPYGFGRHASPQAFGHGGAQSSMSFADPAFKLTGVIIANARAGEGQHQRRHRDLMTAIYEDLGLMVS